ncbi:hypothetical protein WH95_13760 [Kiloniella litopenaei]|uniref:Uncharacterized protein n=2 Tax=Kiloniella litopenaei TaxID=1549748 RepID=A0A0M2R9L0_9PROT|nr:hypothetical protein WH95_13760 [Kiloniella litopenaei]
MILPSNWAGLLNLGIKISKWLFLDMTRLLKAVERLALAVDTIEKNIDATSNESGDALQKLQTNLDKSLKENAELKTMKQEVSDRLDNVIGQLSASLEN